MTSRTIVLKQAAGFISGLQGALKAQAGYLQSLEIKDMFGARLNPQRTLIKGEVSKSHGEYESTQRKISTPSSETQRLRTAISTLGDLHNKLGSELAFAKREIAYGKFDAEDLKELFNLCRGVFIPISGMSSIADIFDRAAERHRDQFQEIDSTEKSNEKEERQWNDIMKSLHGSFENMTEALDGGLQHTLITLQLANSTKKNDVLKRQTANQTLHDVEEQGGSIRPGEKDFATFLTRKIDEFYNQRKLSLAIWCKQRNISVDENLFSSSSVLVPHIIADYDDAWQHQQSQRQLYLILYVSISLDSSGVLNNWLNCCLSFVFMAP